MWMTTCTFLRSAKLFRYPAVSSALKNFWRGAKSGMWVLLWMGYGMTSITSLSFVCTQMATELMGIYGLHWKRLQYLWIFMTTCRLPEAYYWFSKWYQSHSSSVGVFILKVYQWHLLSSKSTQERDGRFEPWVIFLPDMGVGAGLPKKAARHSRWVNAQFCLRSVKIFDQFTIVLSTFFLISKKGCIQLLDHMLLCEGCRALLSWVGPALVVRWAFHAISVV